jgi:hypothetical protein
MIAKKTSPSNAILSATALDPRAMPSARAWMLNPMVVFERPVALSEMYVVPEEAGLSKRGVEGRDASGMGDSTWLWRNSGGRKVRRCMTRYPATRVSAMAR